MLRLGLSIWHRAIRRKTATPPADGSTSNAVLLADGTPVLLADGTPLLLAS